MMLLRWVSIQDCLLGRSGRHFQRHYCLGDHLFSHIPSTEPNLHGAIKKFSWLQADGLCAVQPVTCLCTEHSFCATHSTRNHVPNVRTQLVHLAKDIYEVVLLRTPILHSSLMQLNQQLNYFLRIFYLKKSYWQCCLLKFSDICWK